MSWIQTSTGQRFDLSNPSQAQVSLSDIAHALGHLCRFNGHTYMPYSVARHSLLVAELVPPEHRLQALLHDAHEAYIGDMSTPLKWILPEYRAIEKPIWGAVATAFGIPEELAPEVNHADRVMLMTERRDLLTHCPEPWDEDLEAVKPRLRSITFADTRGFGQSDARDFSVAVTAELLKRRSSV